MINEPVSSTADPRVAAPSAQPALRDHRILTDSEPPPGSPGESHPRAPTERNVTVSRHSALLIHPSELGHPCPVGEEIGLSPLESVPPGLCFLECPEPFELSASPPHQVGVDAAQETVHLGPVELAVVLHPAADDGIHPLSEFCQVPGGPQMQSPPADCLSLVLERVLADRR